jgi:hypothetical protein
MSNELRWPEKKEYLRLDSGRFKARVAKAI